MNNNKNNEYMSDITEKTALNRELVGLEYNYYEDGSYFGIGKTETKKIVVSKLLANLDELEELANDTDDNLFEVLQYHNTSSRRMCEKNGNDDGSFELSSVCAGNVGDEREEYNLAVKKGEIENYASEYDSIIDSTNEVIVIPATGEDKNRWVRVAVVAITGLVIIGIIVIDAKISGQKPKRPKKPKKR